MDSNLIETTYRGDAMRIWTTPGVKDVTRTVFDDSIWKMDSSTPVPPVPLDVQIEVTDVCNLRCEACPSPLDEREADYMPYETLKRVVDQAAEAGVAYFTICGIGEPTLHPNLFELFAYIRGLKLEPKGLRTLTVMPTVLISNGYWSKNTLDACIESPPDLVSFSLAGVTREEIESRRAPLQLDRFVQIVSELHSRREVVHPLTGQLLPVIHVSTHIYPDEMRSRGADIDAFVGRFSKFADAVVVKPTELSLRHTEYEHYRGDHVGLGDHSYERTIPCFETSRRLSLAVSGDVWCGHNLPQDFGISLGNVNDESVMDIWNGQKLTAFRNAVRNADFHLAACHACGGEIREYRDDGTLKFEPAHVDDCGVTGSASE